jgi:U4/U6 small nuclear ribonucleoprotein PRP31
MTTLADSFLDDLDELGDSSDDEKEEEVKKEGSKPKTDSASAMDMAKDLDDLDDDSDDDDDDDDAEAGFEDMLGDEDDTGVASVATLRASFRFKEHMEKVKEALENPRTDSFVGVLEDDPEYQLIVASQDLMTEMGQEVENVFRYVVDLYSKKFPELQSLVPNALDYVRVVMRIGNEMDMTAIDLDDLLPSAQVMVVSVTGSTTSGQALPKDALSNCMGGCEEALALDQARIDMLMFIESRMNVFAPNVSAIVGSNLAAQLTGLAGGLIALSKIPSCNIQLLGQEKNKALGFSAAATLPHTGIIYGCELVQLTPPYLRQKCLRVVAAKVTLAARMDAYQNVSDGGTGQRFRKELQEKIEKWQEPDKQKQKKALPKPDSMPRRKRGGKRVRKMKERTAMTDVRTLANKRTFATAGTSEYGDDCMGMDVGMIGKEGSGKLRVNKKDAKLAKKARLKALTGGNSNQTNGLSSSLAFTPVQGIELMNPHAQQQKIRDANNKYFGAFGGFNKVTK